MKTDVWRAIIVVCRACLDAADPRVLPFVRGQRRPDPARPGVVARKLRLGGRLHMRLCAVDDRLDEAFARWIRWSELDAGVIDDAPFTPTHDRSPDDFRRKLGLASLPLKVNPRAENRESILMLEERADRTDVDQRHAHSSDARLDTGRQRHSWCSAALVSHGWGNGTMGPIGPMGPIGGR